MLNYYKTWRFINSGPGSASHNMALDEAIAISVRKNDSLPTLRVYTWDKPSVSIGCFQKIRDVNIKYCQNAGIPIVRRPTGGRAILHNEELTYSFSVKTDNELFSKGIFDSYKKISAALLLALSKIGLSPESKLIRETRHPSLPGLAPRNGAGVTRHSKSPLCFQSISYGEITISNRKIIGSAQKRWIDGLLQQGSIPYSVEESLIQKVFRLQSSQNIKETIAGLKDMISGLSDKEFKEVIRISFEETFNIKFIPDLPSQEEESLALKLELDKYRISEWNLRQ